MSNWRDVILQNFAPNAARVTLVADPDGVMLEEKILEDLKNRGFGTIAFEDSVSFRYAYETNFRATWDDGKNSDLVVIVQSDVRVVQRLPYDVLSGARVVSVSLADLFPNYSYAVIRTLSRSEFDSLDEATRQYAPSKLGDRATKDFLLRHVFGLAPELVRQPSDLLQLLLRRHYQQQRIPETLDDRLLEILNARGTFADWPLGLLLSHREQFFAFLQERWPLFLDRVSNSTSTPAHHFKPQVSGPTDLPFEHTDVRVYIDSLFLEGQLHPVDHPKATSLINSWMNLGIKTNVQDDRAKRIEKLTEVVKTSLPDDSARHSDWFRFARQWAELILLTKDSASCSSETMAEIECIQTRLDTSFGSWLLKRYAGLTSLPPHPPVMLHHIPRFLAAQTERGLKVALVIVDGLALDQWLVIREVLEQQNKRLSFQESAVFAWVPSVTSVSRQATFAGKPPMFFPSSIHSTDKEPAYWEQFWSDQGIAPTQVTYMKGLGDNSAEPVTESISPNIRVVGLVVDKVDRIMHGMELGTAGMHNQVRQWSNQRYLSDLFNGLHDLGFSIFLTSDHGNIEAKGFGRPTEGAAADLRGERVRVYPDQNLRAHVKAAFPTAIEWEPNGLPNNYLPLIAPSRNAFIRNDESIVGHGGIAIEELIVPFVQIERGPA